MSEHPAVTDQNDAEDAALEWRGVKAPGSVAEQTLDAIRSAGFLVILDPTDRVHRIRWPRELTSTAGPVLVGMVIIRDGCIRYAEFRGDVFAWWGNDDRSAKHRWSVEGFLAAVQEGARK